jgi:hypothetical protein
MWLNWTGIQNTFQFALKYSKIFRFQCAKSSFRFALDSLAEESAKKSHSSKGIFIKGGYWLRPCPYGITLNCPLDVHVIPDFQRSHMFPSPCSLNLNESEMKGLVIFSDWIGSLFCLRRHFNGSPKTFTFSILLEVIGGRVNVTYHLCSQRTRQFHSNFFPLSVHIEYGIECYCDSPESALAVSAELLFGRNWKPRDIREPSYIQPMIQSPLWTWCRSMCQMRFMLSASYQYRRRGLGFGFRSPVHKLHQWKNFSTSVALTAPRKSYYGKSNIACTIALPVSRDCEPAGGSYLR